MNIPPIENKVPEKIAVFTEGTSLATSRNTQTEITDSKTVTYAMSPRINPHVPYSIVERDLVNTRTKATPTIVLIIPIRNEINPE